MTTSKTRYLIFLAALSLFALWAGSALFAQYSSPEDVNESTGWKKSAVVEGLEHPWGMAFLPNGDILITERPGRLRLVQDGQLRQEPITGLPQVFARNQGGLLDISIDPDFAQNQTIYFSYSSGTHDSNRTTVARARLQDHELVEKEVIFESAPPKSEGQHFGSRIIWLPDQTMLISIGDGGNPPLEIEGVLAREHAQKLDSHWGSIVRVNRDGTVPEDNPFINDENAKPEIFSYGHRNIQGMALDIVSGKIWVSEHGPFGGDELNLVQQGANHGWPRATHGRDYRTRERITPYETLEGMVDPKLVWTPAQAPSGLAFYSGEAFPDWKGNLFSGGLVSKEIRRIIVDDDRVTDEEKLTIGERVRDVVQGPDGYLYVLTDEKNGKLFQIVPE